MNKAHRVALAAVVIASSAFVLAATPKTPSPYETCKSSGKQERDCHGLMDIREREAFNKREQAAKDRERAAQASKDSLRKFHEGQEQAAREAAERQRRRDHKMR